MKRRDLIILGGAAAAWPLAARAAGANVQKRVGVLMMATEDDPAGQREAGAFSQRLEELGWYDGKNLTLIVGWGASDPTRATQTAADLVSAAPDVILAVSPAGVAALSPVAGSTPIIFVQMGDPVGEGFVASFAHPGGNITGFTSYDPSLAGKWLYLLKEIAPGVGEVGLLFDSGNLVFDSGNLGSAVYMPPLTATAPSVAVTLVQLPVENGSEVDSTVASFATKPGRGLCVLPSPFSIAHRESIVASIERTPLPAVYWDQSFAVFGGLICYGIDIPDNFRRAADYVDRILKGAKPGDLPVQSPTKYDLVINLKTAKTLGLTVPQSLVVQADQVIE